MLQEGNQRSGNRHDLRRRHIHVFHAVAGRQHEFVLIATRDQFIEQLALFVDGGIGLRDDVLAFLDRRQEFNVVGHAAVGDLAIGRFEKAVLVGASVKRKRVDQADVRAFRCLDRADAPIMGRMHVANFKAGPLASQTTRSKRGNTALVGDLGERIGLIHELRQLAGTEEFAHRSGNRLGIDQIVRHQVFGLGLGQTLLDSTLDPYQTGTELIFR